MGFDLITVEPVPKEDHEMFQKIVNGSQGYFRHNGGITIVLSYLGVDMEEIDTTEGLGRKVKMDMNNNNEREAVKHQQSSSQNSSSSSTSLEFLYKSVPLGQAMSKPNGFQVTAKECQQIGRVLSNRNNVVRALAATESVSPFAIPNNPGAVQFLLEFADYCKAASKYGGYYNC